MLDIYSFSETEKEKEDFVLSKNILLPFVVYCEGYFINAYLVDEDGIETPIIITLTDYTIEGLRCWVYEGGEEIPCGLFYVKIYFYEEIRYSSWINFHDFDDDTLEVIAFSCGETYTDIRDSKTYDTVEINDLCWFAENFRYKEDMDEYIHFIYPDDSSLNMNDYGLLYSRDTVLSADFAPQGWRLPTKKEYDDLLALYTGGELKEAGTTYWDAPNTGADNASGFTARGAGWAKKLDQIVGFGVQAKFWCAELFSMNLAYDSADANTFLAKSGHFYSVRFVRSIGSSKVEAAETTHTPMRFSIVPNNNTDNLLIISRYEPVPFIFKALKETSGTIEVRLVDPDLSYVISDLEVLQGTFNGELYYYFMGGLYDIPCGIHRIEVHDGDMIYYSCWFRAEFTELPPEPPIIEVIGSLAKFSTTQGTPSDSQDYLVKGRNLEGDIVVTAPADFNVSDDGVTFAASVNFTPIDEVVEQTVWIRLTGINVRSLQTAEVEHTSSGAAQVDKLVLFEVEEFIIPITTIKYGLLYNWWVTQGPLIPVDMVAAGWGITNNTKDTIFITYLGGAAVAGGKLKEMGLTYWGSPNAGATNEVKFNSKGSGNRKIDGLFENILESSYIWENDFSSGSIGYFLRLAIRLDTSSNFNIDDKNQGFSIRLVRLAVEGDPAADGSACTPYVGNDGKVYRTVRIGTQVWLADNLAETKWNDGVTYIQGWNAGGHVVISNAAWAALATAAVCVYDNDESNL